MIQEKVGTPDRGIRFLTAISAILLLQVSVFILMSLMIANAARAGLGGLAAFPISLLINFLAGMAGVIVWLLLRKRPAFSRLHVILLGVMLISSVIFCIAILPTSAQKAVAGLILSVRQSADFRQANGISFEKADATTGKTILIDNSNLPSKIYSLMPNGERNLIFDAGTLNEGADIAISSSSLAFSPKGTYLYFGIVRPATDIPEPALLNLGEGRLVEAFQNLPGTHSKLFWAEDESYLVAIDYDLYSESETLYVSSWDNPEDLKLVFAAGPDRDHINLHAAAEGNGAVLKEDQVLFSIRHRRSDAVLANYSYDVPSAQLNLLDSQQ